MSLMYSECAFSYRFAARSVARIAEDLGIPDYIVDVRHQSTHTALPSVETLRLDVPVALDWLRERYWNKQEQLLSDTKQKVWFKCRTYRGNRRQNCYVTYSINMVLSCLLVQNGESDVSQSKLFFVPMKRTTPIKVRFVSK